MPSGCGIFCIQRIVTITICFIIKYKVSLHKKHTVFCDASAGVQLYAVREMRYNGLYGLGDFYVSCVFETPES